VPRNPTDQIVGQLTDATIRLVDTNLNLLTRFTGGGAQRDAETPTGGPAEDIWMAWAESVGDVVQISYLTAQLVDSMWAPGRSSPDSA
jgi:hypothetical protein